MGSELKQKKITPLHDRVVVVPAKVSGVTAGGIIIPDTAKEKPLQGTILAVGKGVNGEKLTVKAGDIVLYGRNAGMEIEIDGEKCLVMRETDILAIV